MNIIFLQNYMNIPTYNQWLKDLGIKDTPKHRIIYEEEIDL